MLPSQTLTSSYLNTDPSLKPTLKQLTQTLTNTMLQITSSFINTHTCLTKSLQRQRGDFQGGNVSHLAKIQNWHSEIKETCKSFRKRFARLLGDLKYFMQFREDEILELNQISDTLSNIEITGIGNSMRNQVFEIFEIMDVPLSGGNYVNRNPLQRLPNTGNTKASPLRVISSSRSLAKEGTPTRRVIEVNSNNNPQTTTTRLTPKGSSIINQMPIIVNGANNNPTTIVHNQIPGHIVGHGTPNRFNTPGSIGRASPRYPGNTVDINNSSRSINIQNREGVKSYSRNGSVQIFKDQGALYHRGPSSQSTKQIRSTERRTPSVVSRNISERRLVQNETPKSGRRINSKRKDSYKSKVVVVQGDPKSRRMISHEKRPTVTSESQSRTSDSKRGVLEPINFDSLQRKQIDVNDDSNQSFYEQKGKENGFKFDFNRKETADFQEVNNCREQLRNHVDSRIKVGAGCYIKSAKKENEGGYHNTQRHLNNQHNIQKTVVVNKIDVVNSSKANNINSIKKSINISKKLSDISLFEGELVKFLLFF